MVDYPWPSPPGTTEKPIWTGHGFRLGDALVPVLWNTIGTSGWTDALTRFHEETAGSSHWIDRASRQHALEQLRKHARTESPVILEVGCSSGFMLRLLRERFPHALVIGADYVRGPLEQLAVHMPDVPLLQCDLTECLLPGSSIDTVVLLNVLEHIPDDAAAVRQVYRILKPGGIAIIEVPAGPHLYGIYDKLLLHHRRYSLVALKRLVESAGLQPLEQSHLGFFVYPGFWFVKQWSERCLAKKDTVQQGIVAQNIRDTGKSRLLDVIMRVELLLGKRVSYPIGIRCLLTCAKIA